MGTWLRSLFTLGVVFLSLYFSPANLEAATVTGKVFDVNQQTVDQAWVRISDTVSTATYDAWITNGSFSIELEDGSYKLASYWKSDTDELVQLDKSFTVSGGVVTPALLQAQQGNPNVTGTLKDAASHEVDGVFLYLHLSNTEHAQIRTKVTQGNFGIFLPDGSYQIDGY